MRLRSLRGGLFSRSHYSVFASGTIFCAVVGVWVATSIGYPQTVGIDVHLLPLLPATSVGSYFDPWTQPISIRVDSRHQYYLNSKIISLDKIPAALGDRFKTRANWTVYIIGDDDASYQDVIAAADAIRSAQGSVVLLTSKSGVNT